MIDFRYMHTENDALKNKLRYSKKQVLKTAAITEDFAQKYQVIYLCQTGYSRFTSTVHLMTEPVPYNARDWLLISQSQGVHVYRMYDPPLLRDTFERRIPQERWNIDPTHTDSLERD